MLLAYGLDIKIYCELQININAALFIFTSFSLLSSFCSKTSVMDELLVNVYSINSEYLKSRKMSYSKIITHYSSYLHDNIQYSKLKWMWHNLAPFNKLLHSKVWLVGILFSRKYFWVRIFLSQKIKSTGTEDTFNIIL